MAKIVKITDVKQQQLWLLNDHTFGRSLSCNTVLKGCNASRLHARISWNGDGWTLRDLNSRNGTFVNGRLQTGGDCYPVKSGDLIRFGDTDDEYRLVEDDEPRSFLIACDIKKIETRIPLTGLLPLPSEQRPICTVFCDTNNNFTLENVNGEMIRLVHGKTFHVENISYHVVLNHQNSEMSRTPESEPGPEAGTIRLEIAVSPDEECAEIILYKKTERHTFQPKVHFYLLAYLARMRESQTPQSSSVDLNCKGDDYGWMDCEVICKELMVNREHLAQLVFRVRQEFKIIDPLISEQIIDRRLRGKMRIGFPSHCYSVVPML